MASMTVVVAVMAGRMSFSSMPWRTVRAMYSGNSTAESMVRKNFSTGEEPAPLARMPKRLSCRWKASVPSSAVPR